MPVSKIVERMLQLYIQGSLNVFNRIPFVTALALNKQLNELTRLQKGLKEIVKKEYQKRYNGTNLEENPFWTS